VQGMRAMYRGLPAQGDSFERGTEPLRLSHRDIQRDGLYGMRHLLYGVS